MDLDFQVTQYFLFLLDLCKDPKDVFDCGTAECRLAQTWLEKLCLLECDNLAERRLRNVFLSYLCACLNEGALKGPFLSLPKDEKLNPETDFGEFGDPIFDCSLLKKSPECDPNALGNMNSKFKNCPKPGDKKAGDKDKEGDKDEKSKEVVTAFMHEQLLNYPGIFEDYPFQVLKSPKALPPPATATTVSGQQILHEDVHCLLDAISRELRGDAMPGTSDYLERELSRYKDFIMNYSTLACVVRRENSKAKLRSFLLLHLQNDLVKLLTDLKK